MRRSGWGWAGHPIYNVQTIVSGRGPDSGVSVSMRQWEGSE